MKIFSKSIFCERLKAERLKLNHSQAQLGDALGLYK